MIEVIVWDYFGDEGTGPRGEYISIWEPGQGQGWSLRIAETEAHADRDALLVDQQWPASMTLTEVQHRAECAIAWLQELATV